VKPGSAGPSNPAVAHGRSEGVVEQVDLVGLVGVGLLGAALAERLSCNVGCFATAGGVLAAGFLFTAFNGSYPTVGALASLIHALGMVVIWWAPDTSKKQLQE
jgi:hypothetical protein